MTFWLPSNMNVFEEQLTLKIESRLADIKRVKAQRLSVQMVLQSSEAHLDLLLSSWNFLSKKARIVSLNEAKSMKINLLSVQHDINVLNKKILELNREIVRLEGEVSILESEKQKVKFKLIEIKK